jgi:E2F/DP family winged-helix DNA-binding domain
MESLTARITDLLKIQGRMLFRDLVIHFDLEDPKRKKRIYDIGNVLEGSGLISRETVGKTVTWVWNGTERNDR